MPPLPREIRDKKQKKALLVRRALDDLGAFIGQAEPAAAPAR